MSTHIDPRADQPEIGASDRSPAGGPESAPAGAAGLSSLADQTRGLLAPIWRDWRAGVAAAAGPTVVWALVAGWWMPRGPLTTSQALGSLVISLFVGVNAGLVTRSRWAMLGTPVVFAVVYELVRSGTDGPTVDGVYFSLYGLIAFVVGRGFHTLVSLLPMLLAAAVGAGLARSMTTTSSGGAGRYPRRGVAVVTALGLVALAVGIARPANTATIVDGDGNEMTGSIAELTTVDINGHELAMMIRGHSLENPVLLFLAGGPGGSEMGAMRNHLPELEEHFTVVTWDQRGSGKSYPELDPTDTITLDGYVDDTIAVTNYLRDRFDQDDIYLLGQSWGTTLGVLAVQEQPELYRAFIGTGQMVSQRETDRIFYQDTLDWAQADGNDGLVEELEAIGPPPYEEMFPYETALANEHEVYPYDNSPNSEGQGGFSENLIVEEYTLVDQIHALGAFIDTFAALYPQLQEIDFRQTATDFQIPMFFVQGANEAGGRADLFNEWYPTVNAPTKDLAVLDTSGHRPLWEQPDEFVDYMVTTVLARTSDQ